MPSTAIQRTISVPDHPARLQIVNVYNHMYIILLKYL